LPDIGIIWRIVIEASMGRYEWGGSTGLRIKIGWSRIIATLRRIVATIATLRAIEVRRISTELLWLLFREVALRIKGNSLHRVVHSLMLVGRHVVEITRIRARIRRIEIHIGPLSLECWRWQVGLKTRPSLVRISLWNWIRFLVCIRIHKLFLIVLSTT
jgi:hypothetical protein